MSRNDPRRGQSLRYHARGYKIYRGFDRSIKSLFKFMVRTRESLEHEGKVRFNFILKDILYMLSNEIDGEIGQDLRIKTSS